MSSYTMCFLREIRKNISLDTPLICSYDPECVLGDIILPKITG